MNYGIQKGNDGEPVIGDQPVKFKGDKIIINDREYDSTTQLWALIMQKNPDMEEIDGETEQEYRELIANAGVVEWVQENYTGKYKPLSKTKLLTENGEGITFLPSDIKGLQHRLRLLLGEFKAGNRATRNEIIGIVDNLLNE